MVGQPTAEENMLENGDSKLWLVPEYCESITKKEELDEQFFDDGAVISSIAICSYEPAPPEEMQRN